MVVPLHVCDRPVARCDGWLVNLLASAVCLGTITQVNSQFVVSVV